jgi:FMN-dependent NADH-azoreductase
MRTSDIILSQKEESNVVPKRIEKFIDAYRKEKTHQEITEVELYRTKIVMIDENGNIKRVPILSEH